MCFPFFHLLQGIHNRPSTITRLATCFLLLLPAKSLLAQASGGLVDPFFESDFVSQVHVSAFSLLPSPNTGKILVAGNFTNYVAVLLADGSLDTRGFKAPTFTLDTTRLLESGPVGLNATGLQSYSSANNNGGANGTMIVAGSFDSVRDNVSNTTISAANIARLLPNGTVDPIFSAGGGTDNTVLAVAVQPDDKVIVGGFFTRAGGFFDPAGGVPRNGIARFNANGTVDDTFKPGTGLDTVAISAVYAIAIQPSNGYILIGGSFRRVGDPNVVRQGIVRLKTDGTVDATFNAGGSGIDTPNSEIIRAIAIQPVDGKILIGGNFVNFNGTTFNNIPRLNTDGSPDNTFNKTGAGTSNPNDPNDHGGPVNAFAIQTDGTSITGVIVGGGFTNIVGKPANCIAELTADGSDLVAVSRFNPGTGFNGAVTAFAQKSGATADPLLVGGHFNHFNATTTNPGGSSANKLIRLSKNGSLNAALDLDPATGVSILALAQQGYDRKLVVGGLFQSDALSPSTAFVRLDLDGTIDPDFNTPSKFAGCAGQAVIARGDHRLIVAYNAAETGFLNPPFPDGANGSANTPAAMPATGKLHQYITNVRTPIRNPTNRQSNELSLAAGAYITRLTETGSEDTEDPSSAFNLLSSNVNGVPGGPILALADQGNGSYLAGGYFEQLGSAKGNVTGSLIRFDENGVMSTTATFSPGITAANKYGVSALGIEPGPDANSFRILVGVTLYPPAMPAGGSNTFQVVRLAANGANDSAFAKGTPDSVVNALVQQDNDGHILVGGAFQNYNSVSHPALVRLNFDGSVDPDFPAAGALSAYNGLPPVVTAIRMQMDGKIVVAGIFDQFGDDSDNPRHNIARLNPDGSLDNTFDPASGADEAIRAVLLPDDGSVLIGGDFTKVNNAAHAGLARLTNPPQIAVPDSVIAYRQEAFSYQINASNFPIDYTATGLPANLTVDPTSGIISGIPANLGTYQVTLQATNTTGSSDPATLTLMIKQPPPVITSGLSPACRQGQAFGYQITATNSPTGYAATGLPAGLSLNSVTGRISGTPTDYGSYSPLILASNAGGSGSATLDLVVKQALPVITSNLNPPAKQGVAFSYQVTATNSPIHYATSSLPPGLAFNPTTGKFSGTPTKAGTYRPLVSATNGGGTGSANLNLVVKPLAPAVTSSLSASGKQAVPFSYQITGSNSPTGYGASGLPSGLTVNTSTGKISGTPTVYGTFNVTIKVTNSGGSGSATLKLVLAQGTPPVINSSLNPPSRQGVAFSYQITATNYPTSYATQGLPGGLGLSTSTGKIIGTPNKAGTYKVAVKATNAAGTGTATLTIIVKPPA